MLSIGLSAIVFTLGVISAQISIIIKTGWVGSFFAGLLLLMCVIVAFFLCLNGLGEITNFLLTPSIRR